MRLLMGIKEFPYHGNNSTPKYHLDRLAASLEVMPSLAPDANVSNHLIANRQVKQI